MTPAARTEFVKAVDDRVVAAHRYIIGLWSTLTRSDDPAEAHRIPLPHPYIVPSTDIFPYLFYWDSYFTIVGLAVDGQGNLIRSMVDNFLHELREFGLVLNYSHPSSRTRSQPPYLTLMICEALKQSHGLEWLSQAFVQAKREYQQVWLEGHDAPVGLSRFADQGAPRSELRAQFESGWDFSSRWDGRCHDLVAVDLNSNLYQYERDFALFARLLGDEAEAAKWEAAAAARRERVLRYCYDAEEGIFFDYDVKREEQLTDRLSLATFHPLFAGMVTPEEAERLVQQLARFEHAGGLACTEASYGVHRSPRRQRRYPPFNGPFQWDYPNGWAPLQWVVISGLKRYGYFEDAARIAVKWLTMCAQVFARTGRMWEKYNVVSRDADAVSAYRNQEGFGWTNGVFSALLGRTIGGLEYDLARGRAVVEPLLCPTLAGQAFSAEFRGYLTDRVALSFEVSPDLRCVDVAVDGLGPLTVRVRDLFPQAAVTVTVDGIDAKYRRQTTPYAVVVIEVSGSDGAIRVEWRAAAKPPAQAKEIERLPFFPTRS